MITTDKNRTGAIYAGGHFLVDFSCALILLSCTKDPGLFLLYNFLAFAVQMPIGVLADIVARNHCFAMIGAIMVAAAFFPISTTLKVLFCGLGNACYHIGGGREALLSDTKMTGLGLFVAPGAIGIYLGSLFAGNSIVAGIACALTLLSVLAIIFGCEKRHTISPRTSIRISTSTLMFIIVIIRSVIGLCIQSPWKLSFYIPLAAILGAGGKAAGGIIADRFGGKRTGFISLLIAAGLYCFPNLGIAGIFATFLFNMSMPITLRKAASALKGREGFAFGLLTFGLFLGYLPYCCGIRVPFWVAAILSMTCAGLFLLEPAYD